jgi:hypothetical protein
MMLPLFALLLSRTARKDFFLRHCFAKGAEMNVPYRQDSSAALLVPGRALPTYVFAGTCGTEAIFHTQDIEHIPLLFESVLLQYVRAGGLTTLLVGVEVTNIAKFSSTFFTLEWE